MLQDFDLETRDKNGVENVVAGHLSQPTFDNDELPIRDSFSIKQLFSIKLLLGTLM